MKVIDKLAERPCDRKSGAFKVPEEDQKTRTH